MRSLAKVCTFEQFAKLEFVYISWMARAMTMLESYVEHRGLYARVAKALGLDPSYVSRVANGKRRCERVRQAIEDELMKMNSRGRRNSKFSVTKKVSRASNNRRAASAQRRSYERTVRT
jgi:hypothetical protein